MTIGDICAKAADLLDEHGWCQHVVENREGHMCALGALARAASGSALDWSSESYFAARRAVMERLPYHEPFNSIAYWNNKPERTKEEVTGLLRKVAADLGRTEL